MDTIIELTEQEKEIMRRRNADQSFAQIGRDMNIPMQTVWGMYQRMQKRLERKQKIDAGYIDPTKNGWGGTKEKVIEFVNQNPGSTTAEISRALKRDTKGFSAQLAGMATKGHVRRFKQDGMMRHYPKNYLKPAMSVQTSSPLEPEVPKQWTKFLNEVQLKIVRGRMAGKSLDQLCEELHVPRGTVSSNLHRARVKLEKRHIDLNMIDPKAEQTTEQADTTMPEPILPVAPVVPVNMVKWVEDQFMAYFMASETPSLRGFLAYIKKENDDTTGTT